MPKDEKVMPKSFIDAYGAMYEKFLSDDDSLEGAAICQLFAIKAMERAIQDARYGDVELARTVIVAATTCLRKNTPIPNHLGQYLAEILEAVLEEEDPKNYAKALKLVSKKGRNSQKGYFSNNSESHLDWKYAVLVQRYINNNIPLCSNREQNGALTLVSEEVDRSESTIKRAYYANKGRVKSSDPDTIEKIATTLTKFKLL